jgi:hypothetical protein
VRFASLHRKAARRAWKGCQDAPGMKLEDLVRESSAARVLPEGRCIQHVSRERVPDLRVGATGLVCHNCDARKPVPPDGKLHVNWGMPRA